MLSRYAVYRALHSFPTRRSSDLRGRDAGREIRDATDPGDANPHRACDDHLRHGGHADGVRAEHAQHAHLGGGDRKSTRLNSSHVEISYAVFCLKKKKNEIDLANI